MDSAEIYESIQSSPILKSIIEIEDVSYGDSNVILIPPIEKRNVIYKYFPEMRDYEIYLIFNNSQFKAIVDAVRTKLLKWSFQLEKNGIIGENSSFSNDELEIANKNNENYKFVITNSNAQFENNDTQLGKNQDSRDKLKDNDNSKIDVIENSLCFVLMPFDEKFNGIYDLIKEELDNFNLNIIRADDINEPGTVIDDICNHMKNSKFLIAELTDLNPNVFYEVGYADALDKNIILIIQKSQNNSEKFPFDVSGKRMIIYDDTIAGQKNLKSKLQKYVRNIINR